MGKEVIRTTEARAAIAQMSVEEQEEFLRLSLILHETGRLEYPYGEKVGARRICLRCGFARVGTFVSFTHMTMERVSGF